MIETARPTPTEGNDGLAFLVLADSGIEKDDNGYARTVLLGRWSTKANRLMKASMRVDRTPEESYADAYLWSNHGWVRVTSISPEVWWSSVPGFQRAGNEDSKNKTLKLAADLAVALRNIEKHADF